jgi:hypothetical protein
MGAEDPSTTEEGSPVITKRPKTKKKTEVDIDFTKALDEEMPDVFAPPKNAKSLLLPANRPQCNTTLPEDCHYQPEDLAKLFLLPNIMVMLITELWDCLLILSKHYLDIFFLLMKDLLWLQCLGKRRKKFSGNYFFKTYYTIF